MLWVLRPNEKKEEKEIKWACVVYVVFGPRTKERKEYGLVDYLGVSLYFVSDEVKVESVCVC